MLCSSQSGVREFLTIPVVCFLPPAEMWAITHDSQGSTVHVRNLYWDGFGFYSVIKSPEYGYAYFGNGVPNYDIAFML